MDAELFRRAQQLFEQVVSLSAAEREALLQSEPDTDLRQLVEKWLENDHQAEERAFLATQPFQMQWDSAKFSANEARELTGIEIGSYRIGPLIGSGGMGQVYQASRIRDYSNIVAIKVATSALPKDRALRAFQNEVQLHARVGQHPNIVGLHDAGVTEDGRCYLVMEYVDGVSLIQYCQNQRVDWRGRLTLFRKVCDAVSHAHQRMVTHRDLKPENILVTKDGIPKLTDFGIAAEIQEENQLNKTIVRGLSVNYASPQQLQGSPLTALTDVYSLGVILYQLITDQLPFDLSTASPEQALHTVTHQEAPLLGQILPKARPTAVRDSRMPTEYMTDFDAVIHKAMAKDSRERYQSVSEFSADIERLLDGQPVLAQRLTRWYRAKKFVRRNRLAVAVACALLVTLVGGTVGTTVGMIRAQQEHEHAQASLTLARSMLRDILAVLNSQATVDSSGTHQLRLNLQQAVERSLNKLFEEVTPTDADAKSLADIASQTGRLFHLVGDRTRALLWLDRAAANYRSILETDPTQRETKQLLAECLLEVAEIHREDARTDDAKAVATSAMSLLPAGGFGTDSETLTLAECVRTLGKIDEFERQFPAALEKFEHARVLLTPLVKQHGDNPIMKFQLAQVLNDASAVTDQQGENASAEQFAREGLVYIRELLQAAPYVPHYQAQEAILLGNLGNSLSYQNRDGKPEMKQSIEAWTRLANANPDVVEYRARVAQLCRNLGETLIDENMLDEAEIYLTRSVKERERILADAPEDLVLMAGVAKTYRSLGDVKEMQEQYEAALQYYDRAVEMHRTTIQRLPDEVQFTEALAVTQGARARTLRRMERWADAIESYQAAIATAKTAQQKSARVALLVSVLDNAYAGVTWPYFHLGQMDALVQTYNDWEGLITDRPDRLGSAGAQLAVMVSEAAQAQTPLFSGAEQRATDLLRRAIQGGFKLSELADDPDFKSIQSLSAYAELQALDSSLHGQPEAVP